MYLARESHLMQSPYHKPPSVAASVDDEQDVAPDTVAGTPTRRRRSGALASRKTFAQTKTKITCRYCVYLCGILHVAGFVGL